ncbi:hypothetical protein KCP69_01265 [Salmonella enterica subsp. enterica]|nr:hypothetical protein KCP69_01265 [Salmonella enterica subsp. enterica]
MCGTAMVVTGRVLPSSTARWVGVIAAQSIGEPVILFADAYVPHRWCRRVAAESSIQQNKSGSNASAT